MNIANNWRDYEILDMADGQKLERWGNVILSRSTNRMERQKFSRKVEASKCNIS